MLVFGSIALFSLHVRENRPSDSVPGSRRVPLRVHITTPRHSDSIPGSRRVSLCVNRTIPRVSYCVGVCQLWKRGGLSAVVECGYPRPFSLHIDFHISRVRLLCLYLVFLGGKRLARTLICMAFRSPSCRAPAPLCYHGFLDLFFESQSESNSNNCRS